MSINTKKDENDDGINFNFFIFIFQIFLFCLSLQRWVASLWWQHAGSIDT